MPLHKRRRLNSEQAFDRGGDVNVMYQQKRQEEMVDVWTGGKEYGTHMRQIRVITVGWSSKWLIVTIASRLLTLTQCHRT